MGTRVFGLQSRTVRFGLDYRDMQDSDFTRTWTYVTRADSATAYLAYGIEVCLTSITLKPSNRTCTSQQINESRSSVTFAALLITVMWHEALDDRNFIRALFVDYRSKSFDLELADRTTSTTFAPKQLVPVCSFWKIALGLPGKCTINTFQPMTKMLTNSFEIDWLTALRHISTERLLVPRNVAKYDMMWQRRVLM